jgi:molybdopterin synthase catalytic subunit
MVKKIRLPDDTIAILVEKEKLSEEFETEGSVLSFWGHVRCKADGKLYRRADALLRDYVASDMDVLVPV